MTQCIYQTLLTKNLFAVANTREMFQLFPFSLSHQPNQQQIYLHKSVRKKAFWHGKI
jgi:hypothetical protein